MNLYTHCDGGTGASDMLWLGVVAYEFLLSVLTGIIKCCCI